ncbi:YdcF family protein [Thermohalobacter berrensis]|uniref:YdcF family protein n=1 Tax=Thermohalobacter berrensis TaxID=99594 RepID=UPI001A9BAFEB|nr:YdcF family protein [Thermohalobacter berrensis]
MKKINYTKLLYKLPLYFFIMWFVSFMLIEGLIITSIKSDENFKVKYLLILGAGLRGEEPSLTLMTRLNRGLEYLERNPKTKVIVSGGQGPDELITEAEAMKRFLIKNGIEENRIIKEEKSTSTYENIIFTKKILDKEEGKKKHDIMIVTSDYHLFRAKYLAYLNGFNPYVLSAKTPRFLIVTYFIREYFAIIKSLIFDTGLIF